MKVSQASPDSGRWLWVDFIRVTAVFCVIVLHSAAPLLYEFGKISWLSWWTGNAYDSAVRMSVPLFFMLSGMLLLGKREPLWLFFRKRILKVVIPFVAWSLIYLVWQVTFRGEVIDWGHELVKALHDPVRYHLWFLYPLLGLYLVMPVLRIFIQYAGGTLVGFFLLLWFLFATVFPLFSHYGLLTIGFIPQMVTGYIGYLVLGYVLAGWTPSVRLLWISGLIFLVSAGVTALGTYLESASQGSFQETYYDYLSPNVAILSSAAFLVLRNSATLKDRLSSKIPTGLLIEMSQASFGIYLVHVIFMDLLSQENWSFRLNAFIGNPLYSIPLTALVVFTLSFLTVFLLRRIPGLRNIVP